MFQFLHHLRNGAKSNVTIHAEIIHFTCESRASVVKILVIRVRLPTYTAYDAALFVELAQECG